MSDFAEFLKLMGRASGEEEEGQPQTPAVMLPPTPETEFLRRMVASAVGGVVGLPTAIPSLVTEPVGGKVHEFFREANIKTHEAIREIMGVSEPPDTLGDRIAEFLGTIAGAIVPVGGATRLASSLARSSKLGEVIGNISVKAPFVARTLQSALEGTAAVSVLEDPTLKDVAYGIALDWVLRSYKVAKFLQPGKEKIPIWNPVEGRWARISDLAVDENFGILAKLASAADVSKLPVTDKELVDAFVRSPLVRSMWREAIEKASPIVKEGKTFKLELAYENGRRVEIPLTSKEAVASALGHIHDGAKIVAIEAPKGKLSVVREMLVVQEPEHVVTMVRAAEKKPIEAPVITLTNPTEDKAVTVVYGSSKWAKEAPNVRRGYWSISSIEVPETYGDAELASLARGISMDAFGMRISLVDAKGFPVPVSPAPKSYAIWYYPKAQRLQWHPIGFVPKDTEATLRAVKLSPDEYADPLVRAKVVSQYKEALGRKPKPIVDEVKPKDVEVDDVTITSVKELPEHVANSLPPELHDFAKKFSTKVYADLKFVSDQEAAFPLYFRKSNGEREILISRNPLPENLRHEVVHAALDVMDKERRLEMFKELRKALDTDPDLEARLLDAMSRDPYLSTYAGMEGDIANERMTTLVDMALNENKLAPIVEKYIGDDTSFGTATKGGHITKEEDALVFKGEKFTPRIDHISGVKVDSYVAYTEAEAPKGPVGDAIKYLMNEHGASGVFVSISPRQKSEFEGALRRLIGLSESDKIAYKGNILVVNGNELGLFRVKAVGDRYSLVAPLDAVVSEALYRGTRVNGPVTYGLIYNVARRSFSKLVGVLSQSKELTPEARKALAEIKDVELTFDDYGRVVAVRVSNKEAADVVRKLFEKYNITDELLVVPETYQASLMEFVTKAFEHLIEYSDKPRKFELVESVDKLEFHKVINVLMKQHKENGVFALVTSEAEPKRVDWFLTSPGGRRVHVVTDSIFESGEYSTLPVEIRERLGIGYDLLAVVARVPEAEKAAVSKNLLNRFQFAIEKNVLMARAIDKNPQALSSFYEDALARGYLVRLDPSARRITLINETSGETVSFAEASEALSFLRNAPVVKEGYVTIDDAAASIIEEKLANTLDELAKNLEPMDALAPAQVNMLVKFRNRMKDAKDAVGSALASMFMFTRGASEVVTASVRKRIIGELKVEIPEDMLPYALYARVDKAVAESSSRSADEIAEVVAKIYKVAPTDEERKRITLALLHYVGMPDEKLTSAELVAKREFMEENKALWKDEYNKLVDELRSLYKQYFNEIMDKTPENINENLNEIFAYVTKLYSERSISSRVLLEKEDLRYAMDARQALQERERVLSRFQLEQSLLPIDYVVAKYIAEKNYLIHVKPVVNDVYYGQTFYANMARAFHGAKNRVAASVADSAAVFLKSLADEASGRIIPDSLYTSAMANVLEEAGVSRRAVADFLSMLHTIVYANTLGFRITSVFRNSLSSVLLTLPVAGPKHYSAAIRMWKEFNQGLHQEYKHPIFMSFLKEYDDAKAQAIRLLRGKANKTREYAEIFAEKALIGMRFSERHIRGISFFSGVSWARAILSELKGVSKLTDEGKLWLERETIMGFFKPEARRELMEKLQGVLSGRIEPIDFERALGRELVRNTMWAYGPIEVPRALKSPVRRLLFMYHTWPMNYASYLTQLFSRNTLTSPYMKRAALRFLAVHSLGVMAFAEMGITASSMFFVDPLDYQGGPVLTATLDLLDMLRMRGSERSLALHRFFKSTMSSLVVPGGSAVREYARTIHLFSRGDYADAIRSLGGTPTSVVGRENIRRKRMLQSEVIREVMPPKLREYGTPIARYVW